MSVPEPSIGWPAWLRMCADDASTHDDGAGLLGAAEEIERLKRERDEARDLARCLTARLFRSQLCAPDDRRDLLVKYPWLRDSQNATE